MAARNKFSISADPVSVSKCCSSSHFFLLRYSGSGQQERHCSQGENGPRLGCMLQPGLGRASHSCRCCDSFFIMIITTTTSTSSRASAHRQSKSINDLSSAASSPRHQHQHRPALSSVRTSDGGITNITNTRAVPCVGSDHNYW